MKKWSEIKQATLNKLFLDEIEAQQQGYLEKFQYLANECLNLIANGVKPKIRSITVLVKDLSEYNNTIVGYDFIYIPSSDKIGYYSDGVYYEDTPDDKTLYEVNPGEVYIFKNNSLIRVESDGGYVTMPTDFLSFTDTVNYLKLDYVDLMLNYGKSIAYCFRNKDVVIENPEVIYLDDIRISLPDYGAYTIFYNSLWDEISKEDIDNDNVLDISYSVLNCLPTYIAAQLLHQDDVQRSARLQNEFELLLARLDTNVLTQNSHYRSAGGWY